MDVLKTPAERFSDLPDYPFSPHYLSVEPGLELHYLDEGAPGGPPVLLLHGEPSWSYLYRKMIPPLARAGYRVLAPDLIGFGKSDKPTDPRDYSYAKHVAWVLSWMDQLKLEGLTLFCQDWGSLIGLRLVGEHPERFARVVVGNGFLPIAKRPPGAPFLLWRSFARYSPIFPVGRIINSGCVTKLSPAVRAAYDAPFPSRAYQAGARALPGLVPIHPEDPAVPANRAAWEVLGRFERPFLTLFGKNDPILGTTDAPLIAHVPGAKGQPHQRFWGGHFVQEDRGEFLAEAMIAWMKADAQRTSVNT